MKRFLLLSGIFLATSVACAQNSQGSCKREQSSLLELPNSRANECRELALCRVQPGVAEGNAAETRRSQITTSNGILEGIEKSGIKAFLGIPFAQPPVGDLRWKAPQLVQNWDGVRQADTFGPDPMQQPIYGDMGFSADTMSEDCLYLNIWTPAKTMDEKLPVLIYFNGGGLMAGSGSEPRYSGEFLARRGIISCTANYREGIFGFFAHPELSAETDYKGSGNYGFLDQVAAIKWIKDNIEAFGGDPERITIVGESAGSMSVSALMSSPLCQGLFAQAMGSSGSILGATKVATLEEAEREGQEKAKEMGCPSLRELRSLSADDLMAKAAVNSLPTYNIDGYFLTDQPAETFASGRQTRVPLLVGRNSHEMTPFFITMSSSPTVDNAKEACRKFFGDQTDRVFELYGINSDADFLGLPGYQLAGDLFIGFSTWRWWNLHNQTSGQPCYRYYYSHPRPAMRMNDKARANESNQACLDCREQPSQGEAKVAGLAGGVQDKEEGTPDSPASTITPGAVHSADIEYAMATLPTNTVYDWQADDYRVSDIFSSYYVNFVKTGNPNGLGLPQWDSTHEASASAATPVLHIAVDTYQEADPRLEELYQLINHLLTEQK